jgi:hypothetical protein
VCTLFPDGESFTGQLAKGSFVPSTDDELAADWDLVFGTGYFVANVLGSPYNRTATLAGSMGSTLRLELHQPTQSTRAAVVSGVAKDSHGNVFKLAN